MEYKLNIRSDLTDLPALKLELSHAKTVLKNARAQDIEFGKKHYKMSGHRLYLVNEIKKWESKVATMDKIVIDFKNDEKVRAKAAKWAEIKKRAGFGKYNNNEDV